MRDLDHYILYAKGHYITGSVLIDLKKIAKTIKHSDTWEGIIKDLSLLALTAIRSTTSGGNEFAGIPKLTPLTEYENQMLFLYHNREEVMLRFGPSELDDMDEIKSKVNTVYQISIIQSLLVVIARWQLDDEEELTEPDPKVLPLRSPKKNKNKESDDE